SGTPGGPAFRSTRRAGLQAGCSLVPAPNPLTVRCCYPMAGWPTVLLSAELGDLAEDVRRLFQELGVPAGGRAAAGDCIPPIDVLESDDAFEVLMDVPGVP